MAWKKWEGMGKERKGRSHGPMPATEMTGGERVRKMMREKMMDAKVVMPMGRADCFLMRQRMNHNNHTMPKKESMGKRGGY